MQDYIYILQNMVQPYECTTKSEFAKHDYSTQ